MTFQSLYAVNDNVYHKLTQMVNIKKNHRISTDVVFDNNIICLTGIVVYKNQHILNSFRDGTQDSEEFYLHLGERYVHIRYFAMRDEAGAYTGCLEVSQDIAPIQKIDGEKRIL